MSEARIDSLRKGRLQLVDLFRNDAQARHVDVWVSAALLVVNDRETFSQRLRQVGQNTFHCIAVVPSLATSFGQQLALRFEPIGLCVARQSKPAPAFGNEIGSKTNCIL
jgi:hypothetical protein